MPTTNHMAASERLLLFAPPGEETDQWLGMLAQAKLDCRAYESDDDFCRELLAGAGGALIAMEMFTPRAMSRIVEAVGRQEPWSDIPLIVLSAQNEATPISGLRMLELLEPLGHFSILTRPVTALGLVSAAKAALRSRRSQYRVRDGLLQWNRMLRQREQFLNLLAHEVRNPLNALRSAAQILGQVDPLTSTAIEQQALIERQTARLALLIDEVLNVFQLESRRVRMRREPVDLVEVVTRAFAGVASEAAAKRQELRLDKPDHPVYVEGDPDRLHLVFTDLLIHAIRTTPVEKKVEMKLESHDGTAIVRVSDSHAPVSESDIERLFRQFSDLEVGPERSPERDLPFGLTLVEGLVKLHRGSVTAELLDVGCEVQVQLPTINEQPNNLRRPAQTASQSRRVVVIEDNTDGRESLRFLLELWGHTVEAAADGPEGIAKIRAHPPDAALIDIGLPGMTGYDVVRQLRKSMKPCPTLIAMTGYGQPHDRQLALEAGFHSFLVKPIDAIALHDLLAATPPLESRGASSVEPSRQRERADREVQVSNERVNSSNSRSA